MEFTPEQQTEIDKRIKEAVAAKETEIDKKMKETVSAKDTEFTELKTKNEELSKSNDSLNSQIVDSMFKTEGISLNETQLSFIKQSVKKYDASNLDEIKAKSLELLGKKVDFKKEKTKKEPNETKTLNISDPLGLLE